MKTLIVFDTKHGTTRDIAAKLAGAIGPGAETFDLSSGKSPSLEGYEAVVLGGPVYAGSWSKRAAAFAKNQEKSLLSKRFAAFASGNDPKEGVQKLKEALPGSVAGKALALAGTGGAIVMSRMSAFERFIIKAVAKTTTDTSSVDEAAIKALAKAVSGR
jgi:menaquinone-dependent protoporphyrinogen oxidase